MKNILSLILFGILLFNGCTGIYVIKHDESYLSDINKKLTEKTVTIELSNGNTMVGKGVLISSNSISWTELESNDHYNFQSANIQEIRVSNRSRSGKAGFWVGMIAGGAIGASIISSSDYEWLDVVEAGSRKAMCAEGGSKTTRYATGIAIGGLVGGLLGYTIGAIVGSTDKYIFDQDTQSVKIEDGSLIRVKFTSIVQKGSGYIIILFQGREIRLQRSEYNYRGTTKGKQLFIVVPIDVYDSKFK